MANKSKSLSVFRKGVSSARTEKAAAVDDMPMRPDEVIEQPEPKPRAKTRKTAQKGQSAEGGTRRQVYLDEHVYLIVKHLASERGQPIKDFVNSVLDETLQEIDRETYDFMKSRAERRQS